MRCETGPAALVFVLVLAVATAPAAAQTRSFARLRASLAAGTRVIVTTDTGASVEGRVAAVTPDGLTVQLWRDGPERFVAAVETTRIVHHDSVANGVVLGALAGPLVPLGLVALTGNDAFGQVLFAGGLVLAIGGAFAGLLLDDIVRETLYEAPRPPRTAVGPILGRGRAGVGVAVTF